jgi:hypothetical protein
MNCLEFESRLELLARGGLADARRRAEAEAHAEACAPCAAQLADERALSTGLRALAEGMKGATATARTEAALLAAFRVRAASPPAESSGGAAAASNVAAISGHAPARRWSWAKTVAVASLAAAASLAFFVLVRPGAPVNAPATREESAAAPQKKMIEPPPGNDGSGHPSISEAVAVNGKDLEEVAPPAPAPEGPRGYTPRAGFAPRVRAVPAAYVAGNRGSLAQPANEAAAQEVATEFIPLSQAGPYTQAEEGHLVRVELPRSALASFGLPVNAEAAAAGGRVKADVLLGQDGIARAIRFVR